MRRSIPSLIIYTAIVATLALVLSHHAAELYAQVSGVGSNPDCDPRVTNVQLNRVTPTATSTSTARVDVPRPGVPGTQTGGTFQISWQAQSASSCFRIQEFKIEIKIAKTGVLVTEATVAGNITNTTIPIPDRPGINEPLIAVVTANAVPFKPTFTGSGTSRHT